MKIIIYGSQYGTAQRYALELAGRTGIKAVRYEDIADIGAYDTVIYIGALYAGGVLGMKKTLGKADCGGKRIIIATVGLADPADGENIRNIRSGMRKQLAGEVYDKAQIFHLRGGIDYSKLNLKHKTMMSLLYRKAVGLPEAKKTAEVRAMIETYNKQVDFVDYTALDGIIRAAE